MTPVVTVTLPNGESHHVAVASDDIARYIREVVGPGIRTKARAAAGLFLQLSFPFMIEHPSFPRPDGQPVAKVARYGAHGNRLGG